MFIYDSLKSSIS